MHILTVHNAQRQRYIQESEVATLEYLHSTLGCNALPDRVREGLVYEIGHGARGETDLMYVYGVCVWNVHVMCVCTVLCVAHNT